MIIIKVGGGQNINWDYLAQDLVKLSKKEKIILIHGASQKRDQIARQLNHPSQVVTSPSGITSVYTDQEAIDIFLMVYAGLANKTITAKLQQYGLNALGLSGVDGALWQAKAKKNLYAQIDGKTKLLRNNLTGRVEKVNTKLLRLLLKNHYLPVLCPPAISFDGEIVNTDNDWATAVMAGQLSVKKIVVLFEAPGLLKDINDPKSLVKCIDKDQLSKHLTFAQGRMKKKVLGAQKAVNLGVETIYWGDARIKNPISKALSGQGTIIS
jgi:[amino group carrier protein]-L-2-aminoadipate/L-glutamate 6-kinase